MRRLWQFENIEILKLRVSHEDYEASVDDLADLIYKYLCQLQSDQILASETLTVPNMHESEVADAA